MGCRAAVPVQHAAASHGDGRTLARALACGSSPCPCRSSTARFPTMRNGRRTSTQRLSCCGGASLKTVWLVVHCCSGCAHHAIFLQPSAVASTSQLLMIAHSSVDHKCCTIRQGMLLLRHLICSLPSSPLLEITFADAKLHLCFLIGRSQRLCSPLPDRVLDSSSKRGLASV